MTHPLASAKNRGFWAAVSYVQTGDTRSVEDIARQVVALEREMPIFAVAPGTALVAICDAIGAQPRLRAELQPDATIEELLQTSGRAGAPACISTPTAPLRSPGGHRGGASEL